MLNSARINQSIYQRIALPFSKVNAFLKQVQYARAGVLCLFALR